MAVILCLSGLAVLLLVIYLLSKRKYDYWKKRNVPYLKPTPIFGNYGDYILMRKYIGHVVQEMCRAFPDEPVVGAYYGTEPALIVQDPELIKLITTKDFYYFNGREVTEHTHKENTTRNLFFTYGDRWKLVRQNMSPLFTSMKMKSMFHLVEKCTVEFDKMLDVETRMSDVVEVRGLAARYTMDCICSCGFGIDSNTMAQDTENNPFKVMGDMIFEDSTARGVALVARSIWPGIFYRLRFQVFPKSLTDFFHNLMFGVFKERDFKPSARNDLIDVILNMRKNENITCDSLSSTKTNSQKVNFKIDDGFLLAQCIVFFAAGFETSANTLSFTLYELAKREDAQKRAIEEVDEYLRRHDGKVDYECVNELPYLEACVDEAMRLYPVLGVLHREVMENYTLPSGLLLEKGLRIQLPIYHLHHHPDYFPEPERFRPERFLGEGKKNLKPYTYMPFGEGPRICIGLRLSKMQMLAGLVTLLKRFRVELAEGMPRRVEFEPRAFVIQPTIGVHLKLIHRD